MADFEEILKIAYMVPFRKDYPHYASDPYNDRKRWTKFLHQINQELDEKKEKSLNDKITD